MEVEGRKPKGKEHETQTIALLEGRRMVSRRAFLHGAVAAGVATAFFPTAIARAQGTSFRALELPNDQLLRMFDRMLEIRWFERTLADRTAQGKVPGYTGHFYAGQEAVAIGTSFALNPDDYVLSTHRAHGHALAKGVDMKKLAAEIFTKATGQNHGYGGTMHVADPSVGFLGADGIVGPGASFGTGAAFAIKVKGSKQVVLTYGGDGHYGSPHFHSALNEAVIAKLPFIYLVENNQYLQYAHYRMVTPFRDYTMAVRPLGIPAVVVDGQDVLAVYGAVKEAADRARGGDGPSFIEAKTYRYYVHSGAAGVTAGQLGGFGADPLLINVAGQTRPEREVRAWMAKDPIDIFRQTLIGFGVLTAAVAEQREAAAKAKVAEAFQFADDSPVPRAEDGLKNVFADGTIPARHIARA